uniref:OJ000315_02.18 protein n=1 Tax=Oryza sativa subsp. japonica TaxID=39947 RepID=Q7XKZ9_ORYSJ|nr:OJ000315_02.18 [Oryza sativa Japonica Group]
MRDPVYDCVRAISFLQNQVSQLQMQLAIGQGENLCIQMQHRDGNENEKNGRFAAQYRVNRPNLAISQDPLGS